MPPRRFSRRARVRRPRKQVSLLRKVGSAIVPLVTAAGVNLLKAKLGLNTETRYLDFNGSSGNTPGLTFVSPPSSQITQWSGGALIDVATRYIAQGSGLGQRSGVSIRIVRMHIKFRVQMDVPSNQTTKIRFFMTRIPASTANPPGILSSQLAVQDNNYCSFKNIDETDYQIVWKSEKTFSPCYNIAVASSVLPTLEFEMDWKPSVKNGMLTWDQTDTTGNPNNISHGYLQMWYQCSNSNGNVSIEPCTAGVNYYARLEYVDN